MTALSLLRSKITTPVLIRALWILLTVLLLSMATVYQYVDNFLKQRIVLSEPQVFQIRPGESAATVMRNLSQLIEIEHIMATKIWFKLNASDAQFKAGFYDIYPTDRLEQTLRRFAQGKTKQLQIRLVEGRTWQVWREQLQQTPLLVDDLDDAALLQQFRQQSGWSVSHLEGLLMPDTYQVEAGTKASVIVQQAFESLLRFVDSQWQSRQAELPFQDAYEALIMASIIEKETALANERPHIASVFINRLHRGMRLQTDPTVIYGLGDAFNGNLTRAHLRQKTAYNTYRINGLPPTPIAMVGKAAILAALHPIHSEDLYFVAKGDGSHQFSVTLKQHNAAVRKYQLGKE